VASVTLFYASARHLLANAFNPTRGSRQSTG
jgi:hypothetical protein